ncbi:hypothetical protein BB561_001120 [Smittium simulii]|uniref:Trafficking protein particle complex subunit 13 n=1 Tax=Smittium simulii TaxID=133385 RepID=A0A2T9YW10_9FUNG|nr:hypothetical protein BB561_001120 [Smittium simulii]
MAQKEPAPLSLKVMRLAKPFFSSSQIIGLDLGEGEQFSAITRTLKSTYLDFPAKYGIISKHANKNGLLKRKPAYNLPLTENLVLPKDFGALFLGETFYCQFLLANEGLEDLFNVRCTCEIQSNSQKTLLFCNDKVPEDVDSSETSSKTSVNAVSLSSRQIYNFQTKYETKELGLHVLLCTIKYTDKNNTQSVIKRSYKFHIENPIIVKTKTNHLLQQPDKILLEIQVQTTPTIQESMYVQKFQFEPSEDFVAIDLNNASSFEMNNASVNPLSKCIGDNNDQKSKQLESHDSDRIVLESVWSGDFIAPQEVRQYLYLVTPKEILNADTKLDIDNIRKIRYLSALGKLNIAWNWSFGSSGRLQTSQLIRNSPGLHLIEVSGITTVANGEHLLKIDNTIDEVNPEDIELSTQNKEVLENNDIDQSFLSPIKSLQSIVFLEKTFTVKFTLTNTINNFNSSMLISGPMEFNMGIFKPAESKDLEVSYLPVALGVNSVGCLIVNDLNSDYTRKIYNAYTVFVIDS